MMRTKDMALVAFFVALTAVCSWISVPAALPFTMQLFAVFLSTALLGGRRGTLSVLVYILLGAAGLPVFAGFQGGIGVLLGLTGGYITGFILASLLMWLMLQLSGGGRLWLLLSMVAGLLVCYAAGTAWFMLVYARDSGSPGLAAALGTCVLPYLLPDGIKLALAYALTLRLRSVPGIRRMLD